MKKLSLLLIILFTSIAVTQAQNSSSSQVSGEMGYSSFRVPIDLEISYR